MATPHLSLIIPVYNRPNEVEELLDSLTRQSETNFEVVIVEDGRRKLASMWPRLSRIGWMFPIVIFRMVVRQCPQLWGEAE